MLINMKKSRAFYLASSELYGYIKPGYYYWNKEHTELVGPFTSAEEANVPCNYRGGSARRFPVTQTCVCALLIREGKSSILELSKIYQCSTATIWKALRREFPTWPTRHYKKREINTAKAA